MNWETTLVLINSRRLEHDMSILNNLGEQGWEPFAATPDSQWSMQIWLKRRLNGSRPRVD